MNPASDPFRDAREKSGVLKCPFHGEDIVMLLRHEDVRRAAKDWQTFSSDVPFRVPIPSEEDVRTMRQLPIETNPPEHTEYRAIVEPLFQRPKDPAMIAQVEALIEGLLTRALGRESIEIVHEFALPIQSRALTYLLNVPESEAETWIGWGIHVFKVTGGLKKGVELEEYLHAQFDRAEAKPGEDFFSALAHGTFRGRQLTRDEMMGFANLAFAGESYPAAATTLFPRTFHTHIKNGTKVSGGGWHFSPLDQGLTDYGKILPLLRASGYQWYLSVECLGQDAKERPRETIARDFGILRRFLKKA